MIVKTTRPNAAVSPPSGRGAASNRIILKDTRPCGGLFVREIRLRDFERVLEIERSSFGPDAWDRNLFAACRAAGDLFLGAWRAGQLCGYLLAREKHGRAELMSIAVDGPLRKQGVGSVLMDAALRRFRRRRVREVWLMVKTANREAQSCYTKFGFRKRRLVRAYYEDGSDGLHMVVSLARASGALHSE